VWTPFPTHYFSENLVAPGIEPGASGSVARNSDTRPQRRSTTYTRFNLRNLMGCNIDVTDGEFMIYAIDMDSGALYISSFVKIGSAIRKLIWLDKHKDTNTQRER
jgi:hypothetical protein